MVIAFIAIGSNLTTRFGDPTQNLAQALLAIAGLPQTRLIAASSVHITRPVGAQGGDFANSVVKIETGLNAYALLHALQQIEIEFGRPPPGSFSRDPSAYSSAFGLKPARTLDLDILLYGDASIQSPALIVPHPRMLERAFVMQPLLELNPGFPLSRE